MKLNSLINQVQFRILENIMHYVNQNSKDLKKIISNNVTNCKLCTKINMWNLKFNFKVTIFIL